jgi:poly(A) polymerase
MDKAIRIIETLQNVGFQAVYAGGYVRDKIMGLESHDIDIATNATPDTVEKMFEDTIPVGKAFGVIRVIIDEVQYEVATFRSDSKTSDGRHPDSVVFSTIEEDAQRRDLTINGMFFDPIRKNILDYVGGQEDIKNKVIRLIGDPNQRIAEDKLRMMRAIRFSARFDFEIVQSTFDAIVHHASEISQVSAERIFEEIIKILRLHKPHASINMLMESGLMQYIIPEFIAMKGCEQPVDYHPEGCVYQHTLDALSYLKKDASDELLMATLLHDIGKPKTQTFEDRIRFNNHDSVGASLTETILKRMKASNEFTDQVVSLVSNHMKFMHVQDMRSSKLKRFMRMNKFEEHIALHYVDCMSSHGKTDNVDFINKKLIEIEPEQIRPVRLFTGEHLIELGFNPGKIFKVILEEVEDLQLEGQITCFEEAKKFVCDKYGSKEKI